MMLKFSVLTACLCLSAMAHAGDWSSGGGEILKTSTNPWFVQNTKDVHYCVEADPVYFGNLWKSPKEIIETAVAYWKTEFSRTWATDQIKIATQNFVYQPKCSAKTDITFYLGLLPPNSGIYIRDPRSFVSLAVRTGYDEVNLRGRGFVYVAPDDGPLSYEGAGLPKKAWHDRDGIKLTHVLIHELGHVFGLPHIERTIIMSERYPEYVVGVFALPGLDFIWPTLEGMNKEGNLLQGCYSGINQLVNYLNIPDAFPAVCIKVSYDLAKKRGEIKVSGPKSGYDNYIRLGVFTTNEMDTTSSGGVAVWMPEAQTVFPKFEPFQLVTGPQVFERTIVATYKSDAGGKSKPLLLTMASSNWKSGGTRTIGGVVGGKPVLNLMK